MGKHGRPSAAIGGSDIAAIRGESNYATPRDVWRRIVLGEEGDSAGLPATLGTVCEEAILCDYCERNNVERGDMERSVEISMRDEPHFRGELDGFIRKTNVAVDAKLVLSPASSKLFGEAGTDQMSDYILNQAAWYSMIADVDRFDVAAVIWGRPQDYVYERTQGFEAMLLEDARKFWTDYVLTKTPPPAQTVEDVIWEHPQDKAAMRPATNEEAEIVNNWRVLKAKAAEDKVALDIAKAAVCDAIGDSEGLYMGNEGSVTWKANRNGTRVLRG